MNNLLTPRWLRWDPEANHELSWGLNILYGVTAAFSVANLYYTHPILTIIAETFNVSNESASLVPTVLQAGYAGGLLFVIPIGDIVPRRPMILCIIFMCAFIWLGATLTNSFAAFLGLSFIIGLLTVSPQMMFPLAVQYAPPKHRAVMISVVGSGLFFGILVARLLSGIIANYSSWRNVYWLSFGLQIMTLICLYFTMPDYPILRPGTSYPGILLKIITLPFQHPVLMQQSFIAFLMMGTFVGFWTTLTFQLSGVFGYSTLVIGLFALVGIAPIFLNPLVSKYVVSKLHPSGSLIIAHLFALAAALIGTFVGRFSVAGPVIWAFFGDLAMAVMVVANRIAIANVDPKAQNAVNSIYMVLTFCGQLMGTAVANKLYADGGWIISGAMSIGFVGASLLVVLLRGPHESGWVGWRGGWNLLDKTVVEKPAPAQQPPPVQDPNPTQDIEAATETVPPETTSNEKTEA